MNDFMNLKESGNVLRVNIYKLLRSFLLLHKRNSYVSIFSLIWPIVSGFGLYHHLFIAWTLLRRSGVPNESSIFISSFLLLRLRAVLVVNIVPVMVFITCFNVAGVDTMEAVLQQAFVSTCECATYSEVGIFVLLDKL